MLLFFISCKALLVELTKCILKHLAHKRGLKKEKKIYLLVCYQFFSQTKRKNFANFHTIASLYDQILSAEILHYPYVILPQTESKNNSITNLQKKTKIKKPQLLTNPQHHQFKISLIVFRKVFSFFFSANHLTSI